jgi:Four helix bundle sensory module for signal transduction
VDKNLKAVESSLATANGKQTFAALMTAIGEYQTARDEVLALSGQGKQQEAYALNKQKVLPRVSKAVEAFTGLFDSKVAGLGRDAGDERIGPGDRRLGPDALLDRRAAQRSGPALHARLSPAERARPTGGPFALLSQDGVPR